MTTLDPGGPHAVLTAIYLDHLNGSHDGPENFDHHCVSCDRYRLDIEVDRLKAELAAEKNRTATAIARNARLWARLEAEEAENRRLLPVVEAAKACVEDIKAEWSDPANNDWLKPSTHRLIAAVDALGTDAADGAGTGEQRDIHGWFSLSYSNFLVLHRSLLQSMPEPWQHRMVTCLDEMDEAFAHIRMPSFKVTPGSWVYFDEVAEADYERLGITLDCEDDPEQCREPGHVCTYRDEYGEEVEPGLTRIFVPGPDPIPHYNRGRTHVPRADELPAASPAGSSTADEGAAR